MGTSKLLLFDFDGTIANSIGTFLDLGNEMAIKYNKPSFTMEQFQLFNQLSMKEKCRQLGIPLYKIPEFTIEILKKFRQHLSTVPPITDMYDTISNLRENGYRIAILSSNSEVNIRAWLDVQKFDIFDDVIASPGLFGKARSISNLIKKKKLHRDDIVYIGDEVRDIDACKKSHVPIIAVTWGLDSPSYLLQANPDYMAHEPSDIVRILNNHYPERSKRT